MKIFNNPIVVVLINLLLIICQVANSLLSNIVVYESSEKKAFNWQDLLSNKLFWLFIILTVAYNIVCVILGSESKNNKKLRDYARKKSFPKIVNKCVMHIENGEYDEAKFTADMLTYLNERIGECDDSKQKNASKNKKQKNTMQC